MIILKIAETFSSRLNFAVEYEYDSSLFTELDVAMTDIKEDVAMTAIYIV